MRMFKFIASLALPVVALAVSVSAVAQPSETSPARKRKTSAPPPQPLYEKQFGHDMTFVAVYEYKQQKDPPDMDEEDRQVRSYLNSFPKIKKIETAQSGSLRKDLRRYTQGQSIEVWRYQNLRLVRRMTDGEEPVNEYDVTSAAEYGDAPDLADLDWVTADTYQGVEKYKGARCHVYQNRDCTAYVDADSLLPVAVDTDKLTVTYTYGPPPNPPLKLDPKLLEGLKKLDRVWKGLED